MSILKAYFYFKIEYFQKVYRLVQHVVLKINKSQVCFKV